ncbi:hypothetical protein FE257_002376 [Aspergillus nanangensis]|uniref:Uncharacterized protein n=1 Tax=Aspergillus nanangensis TaxID=2582783 RepID=A0AAD4GQ52_ASPNN|nr:hypothetical protein FE257_002376 [Aspergillus nanangensis]
MPDMDHAGTTLAPADDLEHPFFKSHKSLPRSTSIVPNPQVIYVSPLDPVRDNLSDGAVFATAPALPLTPPGIPQDEPRTTKELDQQKSASSHSGAGVRTPSKPSHPPTPETTPPRITPTVKRPGLSQFGQASSSSRAESFQTACEMISDAETETPRRSSQSVLQSTDKKASQRHRRTGSDIAGTPKTPSVFESPVSRMNGSDVETSAKSTGNHSGHLGISRARHAELSNNHPPRAIASEVTRRHTNVRDLDVHRTRPKPLRERVQETREPPTNSSMEQFRETIGWPAVDSRSDHQTSDTRRFSDTSAASTIEAIIIDSPRSSNRALRTLRHTEKRSSLRSTSSPITRSERTSVVSNPESQHRLVHKPGRITENDRKSITSEISNSESSTLGAPKQNVDVIPVVVIPQRRSSLKSSAPTSRNPSKIGSSCRAPTAPRGRPGSLDRPRQRKRTLSDPNAARYPRTESRSRPIGPPVIPPRSSSLSAPTSRNHSRTTSLTSESLRNHTIAMDLEIHNRPAKPPVYDMKRVTSGLGLTEVTDVAKTQSILIGLEDMGHLRPPSAPFTQPSIPSSSPGLIEINEATTVAFFPHNNGSLLLVDPQAHLSSRVPMSRVQYRNDLGQPRTPEVRVPTEPQDVDSPLKNPRRPPKPPTCKVIPPSPTNELDRQPDVAKNAREINERPTRRFAPRRRTWTVRPRSDSFNSFAKSLSLTSAKNRKAGEEIDERLDSFWRPRRFWEDPSESEDSPRDEVRQSPETGLVIKNSLGLPQQRVVFEGPSIGQRNGAAYRFNASRGSLVGSRVFTPEAFYSQTSLHQRRFRSLSWWRLRLRFGRVRNVRKRVRRTLQQRAEGKREAQREKLKQSIGEATLVGSSTQARSTAL